MSVLLEQADGIATLTLNRPDRLNALTMAMLDELMAMLPALAADARVRAVLLTGAGRGFCAGYDLKVAASREGVRPSR